MKRTLVSIALLIALAARGYAEDPAPITVDPAANSFDPAAFHGPLWSKSVSVPFSLFLQLQGMKAETPSAGSVVWLPVVYVGQDFTVYDSGGTLGRIIDYEALLFENRVSWAITDGLELGLTVRLSLIYGGFLDGFIRAFHSAFGFPANGRDVLPDDQVFVSIPNENGLFLELDRAVFGLGDTDLWVKWRFLSTGPVRFSLFGAVKLPTGDASALQGSGYLDAALAALFDWYICPLFALYLNAGLVVPWNAIDASAVSRPYVMGNFILGLEFAPLPWLSAVIQVEVRTSPIENDLYKIAGTDISYFEIPQTGLLIGAALKFGTWTLQLTFKEDLLSANSEDVAFNVAMTIYFR